MPPTTRRTSAQRPTRQSRHVFGDVSNKGKQKQSSDGKGVSKNSNAVAVVEQETEKRTARRRSARLSQGDDNNDNANDNAIMESGARKTRSGKVIDSIDEPSLPVVSRTRSAAATRRTGSAAATKKQTASSRASTTRASKGKASGKGNAKRAREEEEDQPSRKKPRRGSRSKPEPPAAPRSPMKLLEPICDFRIDNELIQHNLYRGATDDLPFDASKYVTGIAPYDLPNRDRVEEVPDYVNDIMQRLYDREYDTRPHPYIADQPHINTNMRSILIDWMVEVHQKFRLIPETLHLGVNILDRYLERVNVERTKLQLVGVTALLIACKYEEIYPPEVQDCVYICDKAYTRQMVLDMEAEILFILEYRMSVPTGFPFLNRFLYIAKATTIQKHAAHYYNERMLQEYMYLKHRPSLIAVSCVCLALNNPSIRHHEGLSGPLPGVPAELLEYTGFELNKIIEVSTKICNKVKITTMTNSQRELGSVKRKYQGNQYAGVSAEFEEPDVGHLLGSGS